MDSPCDTCYFCVDGKCRFNLTYDETLMLCINTQEEEGNE